MIKESIHTIWLDCKSEVLFGIALATAVVLCCCGVPDSGIGLPRNQICTHCFNCNSSHTLQ